MHLDQDVSTHLKTKIIKEIDYKLFNLEAMAGEAGTNSYKNRGGESRIETVSVVLRKLYVC